jgi:hypothetical protein
VWEVVRAVLNPGGLVSITEIIFDPHFQRRSSVREIARLLGFVEIRTLGYWAAYTILFKKL